MASHNCCYPLLSVFYERPKPGRIPNRQAAHTTKATTAIEAAHASKTAHTTKATTSEATETTIGWRIRLLHSPQGVWTQESRGVLTTYIAIKQKDPR